jgi:hypothetical protein
MTNFTSSTYVRSSLRLAFAGLLAGTFTTACDLPDKNLGDDPADDSDGSGSASDSGGVCEPGDTMMMDCNTCSCIDGQWACTAIGCDPTGADSGDVCDPATDPSDECNTCECIDGEWGCTQIACDPVCDPSENPTNGCNTCECDPVTGEWACTDEACPENPAVTICEGTEPADPISVTDASIDGDTLLLAVSHGGGCVVHGYGSCWDGLFAESDPVQAWLLLNHEDNDDACDAIVMEDLTFDLTPMREAWVDAYQQPSGTITLHVADWGSLDYTF